MDSPEEGRGIPAAFVQSLGWALMAAVWAGGGEVVVRESEELEDRHALVARRGREREVILRVVAKADLAHYQADGWTFLVACR